MADYSSPVSFVWNKSSRKDGTQIIYCFAYVRNIETNEVLYAGVKYVGDKERFGRIRKNLRNTAIMRLLNKPIYAIYVLNEGDKVNEVLSDFFVYSSKKSKYANLGIHGGRGDVDIKIYYNRESDSYGTSGNAKDRIINVRYGYYSDGQEMRLITEQKGGLFSGGSNYVLKGGDGIIKLRRRAMFYGSGKDRRRLEDYMELGDDYLMQFGVMRKVNCEKRKSVLRDYHNVNEVKYFKAKLNKRKRLHVSFMKLEDWVDYVSSVYDREMDMDVKVGSDLEDIYCVAYSLEDLSRVDKKNDRRILHKKIVIDRMIEKPTVVSVYGMGEMSMKERRIWFFDRWNGLKNNGMGRWSRFDIILDGDVELWEMGGDLEEMVVYRVRNDRETFFDKVFSKVFNWIHSR